MPGDTRYNTITNNNDNDDDGDDDDYDDDDDNGDLVMTENNVRYAHFLFTSTFRIIYRYFYLCLYTDEHVNKPSWGGFNELRKITQGMPQDLKVIRLIFCLT